MTGVDRRRGTQAVDGAVASTITHAMTRGLFGMRLAVVRAHTEVPGLANFVHVMLQGSVTVTSRWD